MTDDNIEDKGCSMTVEPIDGGSVWTVNTNDIFSFTKPEDQHICFHVNDKMLFEIRADGQIRKGPAFTTEDEMSLKFWELVMDNFNLAWWKGLVKRR